MDGIHPTAIIDPLAELGTDVSIGPYTVIEGPVRIGDGSRIGPHVHISGHTSIGARARIHAGAIVGDEPQDHKYDPSMVTYTSIGDDCVIREYAQIHRSANADKATRIGNHCMIMGFAHVAHDCQLADDVVLVNNVALAGHTEVGRRAFISSHSVTHQFVRIGEFAMVSHGCRIGKDIAPYCTVSDGNRVYGPNVVGLRRGGFDARARQAIRGAIKTLFFGNKPLSELTNDVAATYAGVPEVEAMVAFIRASKRGVITSKPTAVHPPKGQSASDAMAEDGED